MDRSTESCYRWYTERVKTTREEGSRRANYPIPPREGSDETYRFREVGHGKVLSPRKFRLLTTGLPNVPQGVTRRI